MSPEDPAPGGEPERHSGPESEWRHVHPLTPVLKGGAGILAAFGVLFYIALQNMQNLLESFVRGAVGAGTGEEDDGDGGIIEGLGMLRAAIQEHPLLALAGVGLLLLALALVGLGLWLSWRATRYRIDAEGVRLRTGVLAKKERSAAHERVQSVDISLPFLPRLLGLSSLVFDVAGGSGSDITLAYLKRARAEELREEILSHLRGLRSGAGRAEQEAQPGQHGQHSPAGQPGLAGQTGRFAGEETPGTAEEHPGAAGGLGPSAAPGTPGMPGMSGGAGAQDVRAASAAAAPLGQRLVSRQRLQGLQHHAQDVAGDLSASLTELLAPYRLHPQAESEGRLLRVPLHRLAMGALLSTAMLISALALVAFVVLIVVLFVFAPPEAGFSTLFGLIPAVFAIVGVLRSELSLANFTVAITQDGLRVSHGLTSTTNRVIPLDRIQAVKLTQPLLWRIPGWWRATFTMASEAGSDDHAQSVLLPVGSPDDVMLMLGLAMPDPRPAPGVSARALVLAGMQGPAPAGSAQAGPASAEPQRREPAHAGPQPAAGQLAADQPADSQTAEAQPADSQTAETRLAEEQFLGRPRSSRWLDPLTWRRNAHALTGSFALIRSGRLTRVLEFVPHARVQSMRLHQGPLQRRLALSSIQLHISPGPITPSFFHLPAASAARLFDEHAQRTRAAREELDTELQGART